MATAAELQNAPRTPMDRLATATIAGLQIAPRTTVNMPGMTTVAGQRIPPQTPVDRLAMAIWTPPHPVDRTDFSHVAKEMMVNGLIPDYAKDLNSAMSNISQSEYSFKHRLLFETSRRNKIRRLRERGQRGNGVPRKRLHVFTPIGDKLVDSEDGETHLFTYNLDDPEIGDNQKSAKNSITDIEDAEIRFMLIPTRCSHSRQVTFSVMEDETTVDVDACRIRWESLSVRTLNPSTRTPLTVTCKDCASKGVTYSAPYLNVITSTVPKTRSRRRAKRQKTNKKIPKCDRQPLTIRFKDIKAYSLIMSPTQADIGMCAGRCVAPLYAHNAHTILHYALFKKGFVNKRPCCAPYEYENLEYLYKNGTKLAQGVWENAIAINCSCQ